jgi:hypothetical protein
MSESMESRCLLSDTGKQALQKLIDKAYPNGYTPETIVDDFSCIDIEIHLTTVRNILTSLNLDKEDIPCNLKKIGTLFKGLSQLESVSKYSAWLTQYQKEYPCLIEFPPSIGTYVKFAPAKLSISNNRDKKIEQIANLLWKLDYQDSESKFISLSQSKAIAVSIAAPSDWTQQWLMRRLSRLVYEEGIVGGIPEVILLKPEYSNSKLETSLSQWTLVDICAQIATSLKIQGRDPNYVIQALANHNRKQPVLIKVCGLRNDLDRKILIESFWQLLITQIDRLNKNSQYLSYEAKKSPLIMFLLENYTEDCDCIDNLALRHYMLEPLQIDISHAQNWITQNSTVNKALLKNKTKQSIKSLHDHEIINWLCWQESIQQKRLHLLIENLCGLFLTDCKLADIAAHWKI